MMIFGIALFSILSGAGSFFLISRYERFEKAELTTYLLLFVWTAFLFGMSITRLMAIAQGAELIR